MAYNGNGDFQPWDEQIPGIDPDRRRLLAQPPPDFQGTAFSDVPTDGGVPAPPPIKTQPIAPAPAGGAEAPPIKTAGGPGFAERFATLQSEKPQRNDPRFAVPGWKKGLGFAASVLGGTFNPRVNAGELYHHVVAGPYEQALGDWQEKGKGLEEEAKLAEQEQRMKQLDMVPLKVPWQDEPIYVQRKDVGNIQKQIGQSATQEKVTGEKTASAEKIATGREASQEKIAGGREASNERIAGMRTKSAEDIAKERSASAERIAAGHNLAMTEVARIRAASSDDPNKLTNTMKTMKQQAQSTLPGIDRALDETEKMASKLGPVEGRWNAFMTTDVGRADPEFSHYMDEIGMVSSAVTLAHARGRMSNELFEHFQKMFDAGKQAPENMIQALTVAKEWLTEYARMGEPAALANPTKPTAPSTPRKKGQIDFTPLPQPH